MGRPPRIAGSGRSSVRAEHRSWEPGAAGSNPAALTRRNRTMANKGLFASAIAKLLPATDTVNREDAPAYAYGAEAKLAQLAATGTLSDSFYATAETHLSEVL